MLKVPVPGGHVAVHDDGPSDGETVLLVNGARTCAAMWEPVLRHIEGFRTVRFDPLGHGQSDRADDDTAYSIEGFADTALAVLDHLGVATATVWGVAFGARVALAIADRHPERVARLALFDASVERPDVEAQTAGQKAARSARRTAGIPETEGQRDQWFAHDDPQEVDRAMALVARNSEPQPPRIQRLAASGIPVLLAVGDHDPNEPATRRIAAALPQAEFHLLPLTGHGSVVERPDVCAGVCLDWYRRTPPAG